MSAPAAALTRIRRGKDDARRRKSARARPPIPANATKRKVQAGLKRATSCSAALASATSSGLRTRIEHFERLHDLVHVDAHRASATSTIFCASGSPSRAMRIMCRPSAGRARLNSRGHGRGAPHARSPCAWSDRYVEQLGGTAGKGARLVQRATVSLRCQVHGRPEATAVFDRPHNVTTPWRSGVKPPIERPRRPGGRRFRPALQSR